MDVIAVHRVDAQGQVLGRILRDGAGWNGQQGGLHAKQLADVRHDGDTRQFLGLIASGRAADDTDQLHVRRGLNRLQGILAHVSVPDGGNLDLAYELSTPRD